jgi:acyl carrier protein
VSTDTGTAIERLKGWLCERKPKLLSDRGALDDPDFDLIENRVVDSLIFLEFVFFLEELSGRQLDTGPEHMASFRTLRAIEKDILHGSQP